ncbi:MAG: M20/M25/M40 family metallo-hydrolase [Anaerolineales bacterium]|nr:M20/M25/M40 family metallo-hydrolase [Anaerolineales bacterium]
MTTSIVWASEVEQTVRNLSRLIQAQTVNPPGNELPAILLVKEFLERAGVPAEMYTIVESIPNRVNLVARLRGDGSQRPLLLSGHVDVVPVEREHWSRDPFGGEVVDGVVWGRGALDMKGFLAMYLQIFLMLFRQKTPLKRDVILAAIADEEAGFTHGSQFLVEKHPDLIDAEYALTEAGGMTVHLGKTRLYPIQVAEKSVCWLRMRTRGKPGHGSVPHTDNAVFHLAEALEKIHRAGHLPVHVTPTFQAMLSAAGAQISFPGRLATQALQSSGLISLAINRMKGSGRNFLNALTTNTISATMLEAGSKVNVIPSSAEVALDCRLVPGQTSEDVIREIKAITGDKVELEVAYASSGAAFSTETPLYKIMQQAARKMDPEGIVIPMMMPGATDASQYRRAGMTIYGFTPGILPPELPIMSMAHGHDERIPVSYIESGLPVLWEVITQFCGA